MTPIKRGTARRLGLDLPPDTVIYDEIDWSRFALSMKDIEQRMRASLRAGLLFPTHMGRPGHDR